MQREHGVQSGTGVCQESKTCPHDSEDRVFFKKGERNIVRYIHKEGNTAERRKALWYEMKARDSFLNRFLSHFIKGK